MNARIAKKIVKDEDFITWFVEPGDAWYSSAQLKQARAIVNRKDRRYKALTAH